MVSDRGTVSSLAQMTGQDRLYKPGTNKGILALGGATSDYTQWFALDATYGYLSPSLAGIDMGSGHPMATLSVLQTWGNSAIRTDMSTLRTNCQSSGLFASGRVHLIGVSMGGLCALNWAKNNPTLVQSITLVIPVVDVQAVYDGNRVGFASSISSAYGGRPPDADNPADNTSAFLDVPMQMFYSNTDTVTLAAESLAFCSATGCEAINVGDAGHSWSVDVFNPDQSGQPFNGDAVRDFIHAAD